MIGAESHATFRDEITGAELVVLTTHVNPDGDALGSEVSLARFLLSQGKRVRLINQDATPEILRFLEGDGVGVEVYDRARHDAILRDCNRVVLVDNSAPDRLGRMEQVMRRVAGHTLCIDHHPSRNPPWARRIVDERACATSVLIYDLVRGCGWTPDARAAEAIYVGLATDTGFFRFNSTNARAYEVAAELLRLGADPAKVYGAVYERNSLSYTRLLGHALAGVRLYGDGCVASVELRRGLIEQLDAEDVDASEITTALLAMDGISVALLFRELADGRIKVSLRSKGALDVHGLAAEFGGGGHRNASGIVLDGALDDVVRRVTDRVTKQLSA